VLNASGGNPLVLLKMISSSPCFSLFYLLNNVLYLGAMVGVVIMWRKGHKFDLWQDLYCWWKKRTHSEDVIPPKNTVNSRSFIAQSCALIVLYNLLRKVEIISVWVPFPLSPKMLVCFSYSLTFFSNYFNFVLQNHTYRSYNTIAQIQWRV